jgi:hypothetical protein
MREDKGKEGEEIFPRRREPIFQRKARKEMICKNDLITAVLLSTELIMNTHQYLALQKFLQQTVVIWRKK